MESSNGLQQKPVPESFDEVLKKICITTAGKLPEDSWYIIAATLLAVDSGAHFGALFEYVISQSTDKDTPDARRRVSRQLREVIIKEWTLVGMPRVFAAYYSLNSKENPSDRAADFERAEQRATLHPDQVSDRAQSWLKQELAEDEAAVWNSLSANPDLAWATKYIQYGYFLADTSVLNPLENEMVILAAVMGQGAAIATYAHMKSFRRIGATASQAKAFQYVVETIAKWQGKDTSSWHNVSEVEQLFPDT
ncbi:hypothetical protein K432DRAFT_471428 [Lepidopterella palustris CBS 459.81]|uniref:Carboxymuconolactone decarboxylase-like domain-containing protein n=1 Tax=Lepidopterella palustris CBS 459.81 TaxID=1314670 RepID=A0A8E2JH93_9PEZI|nr:hypothetical protein K432DRAFT_471428 [Lepidopterella palustris CBS 459.81]